jgi:SAM-dependent methyltransferase
MAEPEPPGSQYLHSGDWYDTIYAAQGKRYAAEAGVVDGIVRSFAPHAASLLDVGCGTGLHLEELSRRYDDVAGIDLHPGFVARARERGLAVTVGDMRSFDLGRRFDAVVSLYSAIGHVRGPAELDAAVAAMARHLAPRGVLVVEPWVRPEDWRAGEYGVEVADAPGSTLTRVNHTDREREVAVIRLRAASSGSTRSCG